MPTTATDIPAEFLVLGPVDVVRGGASVRLATGRAQTVLAMLLLEAGRVVPFQRLVAALWEDDPPNTARSQVQICVSVLRRRLTGTGAAIFTQPPGYLLRIPDGSLDLWRFRELCGAAESLAGQRPEEAAACYRKALALWRGDACASVASRVVMQAAIHLNEERWTGLERRMALELRLGRHQQVVAELARLVTAEPLRERPRALLMLALYRSGRQADALEAYRSGRRLLAEEIGTDPGKELRALEQAILTGDPLLDVQSQATPEIPGDAVAAIPLLRQLHASVPDFADRDNGTDPVPELRERQAEILATAVPVPGPGRHSAGTDAPAAYEHGRRVLVEKRDTESDVGLHRQLLAADPAAAAPAADVTARGNGETAVPRQLPGTVPSFAGRVGELAALTAVLDQAGPQPPGTVVISAIGGTAGVGKTALAVHWAHQVAGRFADGQLYVNLRGFDPSGTAVTPGAAIRGFLEALGVPADRMPQDLAARGGLYRSLVASRRLLIVLDNARDEQQVRPLLPAGPGCLVVVTSRSQLAGLAAADGARLLSLDLLRDAEARQMLSARIGAGRAAAEPDALADIARLCARLPLALAVAAARAAARPGLPLSALAAELRDVQGRLDVLDAGDPAASVRAVFSWSARHLNPAAARMFRLLGLHPGPDITAPAAASLASLELSEARRLLAELTRAHLLTEHAPGRFAFHDLLRAYATEQARATDSDADRHAATGRMLDHYVHSAYCAAVLINSTREPITVPPPRPGVRPEPLAGHQQALAWFQAEHQVLLAASILAGGTGADVHAWQIPWTMFDFLQRHGHWQQKAEILRTAVAAAARLGDPAGQAVSLRLLSSACVNLGEYEQALAHCAASLRLYQQLGDRVGEAKAHQFLAVAADGQDRHADVLGHAGQALRLYRATGHRPGQACMLNNVAWAQVMLGDYRNARACCLQALTLAAELGMRHAEAHAWDTLGHAEHHLGNLAEAAACYLRALSMFREVGDLPEQADTLTRLGDTRLAAGDLPQARDAWQQALDILDEVHQPDAEKVRAKLASADDRRPPSP